MYSFHGKWTDPMLLADGSFGFHPISRVSRLFAPPAPTVWQQRGKRAMDVILATFGLAFFAIPMLAIGLIVRLDSPGPALFRQQRIGQDGRTFTMLKFRTMRDDPPGSDLRQATRGDPRVTRVGLWLRRTSADELPQFLNVLRGEMSVVGPRPHAPGTRAGGRLFEDVAGGYGGRHKVRPGMTGLAQVRGWRGETDTESKLLGRLASDLEYIETWSLWLDILVLVRTVPLIARMLNAY